MGEQDGPALEVAQGVLGGKTGRLWQELVEKTELCTETSADYTQHRWAGSFSVEGYTKEKATPEQVAEAMQRVVDTLVERPPAGEELERVRTRLTADLMRKLEEPERLVETVGWYAALYDWRYLEGLPARWASVTPDDVKRVAKKYLAKNERIVGLLRLPGGKEGEESDEVKEGEKSAAPAQGK
jgi:predicted Zn-dependent peptidase